MAEDTTNDAKGRIDIIQSVKTPLGFFVLVVLVVEVLLGIIAGLGQGFDRTLAITGMLALIALLIATVALLAWFRPEALVGKPASSADDEEGGLQKIRLNFSELIDIRQLDRQPAVCTFVDSTALDVLDDEQVSPPIISDANEGPTIRVKIPRGKDYVYISVDHEGHTFSGSFAVHSRIVTLNEE